MNILNKDFWLKHKALKNWRFDRYQIWHDDIDYVCQFGHIIIGKTKDPEEARRICGLHAGLIE